MECGEFNKRNKEFLKKYTKESYFQNLLFLKDQKNIDLLKGKGKVIFEVSKNPKTLRTDWANIVYQNKK